MAVCGFVVHRDTGTLGFRYTWNHKSTELPKCALENDIQNCSKLTTNTSRVQYAYSDAFFGTLSQAQCKEFSPQNSLLVKPVSLFIHEARPEDVGQYSCSVVRIRQNIQNLGDTITFPAGTISVGKGRITL